MTFPFYFYIGSKFGEIFPQPLFLEVLNSYLLKFSIFCPHHTWSFHTRGPPPPAWSFYGYQQFHCLNTNITGFWLANLRISNCHITVYWICRLTTDQAIDVNSAKMQNKNHKSLFLRNFSLYVKNLNSMLVPTIYHGKMKDVNLNVIFLPVCFFEPAIEI